MSDKNEYLDVPEGSIGFDANIVGTVKIVIPESISDRDLSSLGKVTQEFFAEMWRRRQQPSYAPSWAVLTPAYPTSDTPPAEPDMRSRGEMMREFVGSHYSRTPPVDEPQVIPKEQS